MTSTVINELATRMAEFANDLRLQGVPVEQAETEMTEFSYREMKELLVAEREYTEELEPVLNKVAGEIAAFVVQAIENKVQNEGRFKSSVRNVAYSKMISAWTEAGLQIEII